MNRRSSALRTFALTCTVVSFMSLALLGPDRVIAQDSPPAAPAPTPPGSGETFKQEQLDQMLAPIALYPDALLSQVLMASTYPLEIVEAARWLEQNKALKGDALSDALKSQPWDESVKSLTAFPEVLDRMNQDIAWTQKLGDAFLGQQQQVMDTVQGLRKKADAAGNLKSNEQQKVTVENSYITVEPANPQVIYVPTYQPTVVYGAWPYPAYPPYYPPYWAAPGAAFVNGVFWGVGIAAGAALWGGFNWNNHDVNINVNRYNNFNHTNISNSNWQHNVAHREGVPYRDNASRTKYGNVDRQAAQAREQFRGHEGSLGGGGLNDRAGLQNAAANRGAGGAAGNRDLGTQVGGAATRDAGGGRGGGLNVGNGSQAHDFSNRGNASMGNRSFSSSGGAAARGGGGMARGGGGGGRGRR
jgi:hypothetical protein